jgi:hypothetical protein
MGRKCPENNKIPSAGIQRRAVQLGLLTVAMCSSETSTDFQDTDS